MIKISAVFVILLSISMFSSLEIARIDSEMLPGKESRASLVQMMVEVQTTANPTTISGFMKALREMLEKLVRAQEKHQQIHKKMMKQCFDEDKFRKKEVADAKAALGRAGIHLVKCQKSLKEAEKALPGLVRTHTEYVKELKRATKQREVEHKKYIQRRDDFREAIAFLSDFIQYINKKLKGHFKAFSFVQFSENLLQHANKLGVISDAVPALVAIAEATYTDEPKSHDYSYHANEALGQKLKRLLGDLLAKLKKDNKTNDDEEKKAVAIFVKYKARLTAAINTLARNIKRIKKQIVDMSNCVRTEKKIIASASKKIARNDGLRIAAAKMCHSFNKEFIEATRNRLDEIKTMKEILIIVRRRFKNLPKDLIKYLDEVEHGWKKYINSTEFKKFVAYKRKQYADNARGKALLTAKNMLK